MKEHRLFYEFARRPLTLFTYFVANVQAEGVENIPKSGPVILACNHLAGMDILAVSVPSSRHLHHMAKTELFQIPVAGGVFRLLGAFAVRRGESDRESLRIALEILQAGQVLVIYPEGHRSDYHALQKGHPGAALIAMRSGAPIVPVGISGTEHIFEGLRYGPFAPRVRVVYGKPFTLQGAGTRRTREDLEHGLDTIMRRIAALLPPKYRGVYADSPVEAPAVAAGANGSGESQQQPLDVGGADPLAAERALGEGPTADETEVEAGG
jgi:1-acyl-sn-glycerol-3-phosphate acyltransferase